MTEEQEAAREALHAAIERHAEAHGNVPPNSMLSTFAVVAHWVPVEENGTQGYSVHYSHPTLPQHVVIGLMETGKNMLYEMEDDD